MNNIQWLVLHEYMHVLASKIFKNKPEVYYTQEHVDAAFPNLNITCVDIENI